MAVHQIGSGTWSLGTCCSSHRRRDGSDQANTRLSARALPRTGIILIVYLSRNRKAPFDTAWHGNIKTNNLQNKRKSSL